MGRVAAVIVTRDDARTIERALGSVAAYVDEFVVLDLGSLDDTVARARRSGARVEIAPWSPDSAAVRNLALAVSRADWNFVLEAGEWVKSGGGEITALRDREPVEAGVVQVVPGGVVRNAGPASLEARLLPAGVRYRGAHRDEPVVGGLGTRVSKVVIASDDTDPARWRHDRARGEAALLQALLLRPDAPDLLAELGALLRSEGRVEEAADAYVSALRTTPADAVARHKVVVDALDALREARRFRDAIVVMDAEMTRWVSSPDFAFVVGDLFFEMLLAEPATAEQLAPLAAASWRRCLEIGERPDLPGTVHGRGSFLAAQDLATLHLAIGLQEEADHWWDEAERLRVKDAGAGTVTRPG